MERDVGTISSSIYPDLSSKEILPNMNSGSYSAVIDIPIIGLNTDNSGCPLVMKLVFIPIDSKS